ncbi:hypothetical protein TSUD_15860 [Trifolium subterraneum]|uniref:Uncharacterized protein n=1 Tax=Trifolium subterraneum TaxID=3900 RepID=A0A2Z6N3S8_TRISU|nr:hypothetical protein TSUD_15860 [Trifolium subterraneum]
MCHQEGETCQYAKKGVTRKVSEIATLCVYCVATGFEIVNNGDVSTPQGPITGQTNGSAGNSASKSVKQVSPSTTGIPGAGIYAAPTIGQPVGGPLVSAVGTPVNLSAPPHMAYGIRAPVPGTVVPGAPMNMVPMTYPMPHHTSAPHR